MMDHTKYQKQFFNPPAMEYQWAKKDSIEKAPVWCSVDLRDGNQALVVPMDLETKLKFFELLVKIGFKEIEVGFPAASETEFEFLRALIDRDMVPEDVTLQVLTQSREHIIRKTFEALEGCKNAIVHVYNSTSLAQREQVFHMEKEQIKQIAIDGATLLKQLTEEAGQKYRFEYSPESFTGTEPEFALEVCNAVLDVAVKSGVPFYHRMTHIGYFRHLLVRKARSSGQILVDLVTSTPFLSQKEQEELDRKLTAQLIGLALEGTITGILHTYNDSVADTIQSDRTELLFGTDRITENLLGMQFQITPFSFFQTNSAGAQVLYSIVRNYIGDTKDKVLFDLYSGTGTIAQILAPVAKHVTGVEIVPEAVEAARINAKQNHLDNCDFICGDVLKVIDSMKEKPDAIVLDPPREGIHPKAMPKILKYGVETIIYISCKATSLKRDLVPLQQAGYRVKKMALVDLFPGTCHVETVCLLTHKD